MSDMVIISSGHKYKSLKYKLIFVETTKLRSFIVMEDYYEHQVNLKCKMVIQASSLYLELEA